MKTKLTSDQIIEIYQSTDVILKIAKKHCIGYETVVKIKCGSIYKEITDNLGDPGECISYKLTDDQREYIATSKKKPSELHTEFPFIHIETIRNIRRRGY